MSIFVELSLASREAVDTSLFKSFEAMPGIGQTVFVHDWDVSEPGEYVVTDIEWHPNIPGDNVLPRLMLLPKEAQA